MSREDIDKYGERYVSLLLREPITGTRAAYTKQWSENRLSIQQKTNLHKMLLEQPHMLREIVWVIDKVDKNISLEDFREITSDYIMMDSWGVKRTDDNGLHFEDIWPRFDVQKPLEFFELIDQFRKKFNKWEKEYENKEKTKKVLEAKSRKKARHKRVNKQALA